MPETATAPASTRPATTSDLFYVLAAPDVPLEQLPTTAAQLAARLRSTAGSSGRQAVAAAFWDLYRNGAIGLEMRRGKSLGFIPKTELLATALRPSSTASGLEAELLAQLERKSPRSVESVVGDWFGRSTGAPEAEVIKRLRRQLEVAGLLDRRTVDANRNAVTGFLLGKTKDLVELDSAAVAGEAARLDQIATDWLAFEAGQPEISRELVTRVGKAIDRKELSDSDSDSGGGGSSFD